MRNYAEHVQPQCENDHNAVSEPSSVLRSDGALRVGKSEPHPHSCRGLNVLIRFKAQQIITRLHVS